MLLKIRTERDKQTAVDYINKLPDKPYDVNIKLHKQTRTCPQNRLYWMWINAISKDTGNEPNDLHEYFGNKWLPEISVQMPDGVLHKNQSTTQLNTAEFTAYLDKIQIFASAELGIILPNPDDLYFDQMVDYYADKF